MATFTPHTFLKHDDYMTPFYAWDHIKEYYCWKIGLENDIIWLK
tara:strand:- start:972 stop:1103 length:132 start_codon:yes stop_codon:yes gene_type:complete